MFFLVAIFAKLFYYTRNKLNFKQTMAKTCQICGKGSRMFGKLNKLRGKYNPVKKKIRKYPNLQKLLVPKDAKHKNYKAYAGQRVLACAKCIKTLSKPK